MKDFLEGNIYGRIEVTGRQGRRPKQLLYKLKETGDTGNIQRRHDMENSLWKSLWTCRKTDCRMITYIVDSVEISSNHRRLSSPLNVPIHVQRENLFLPPGFEPEDY